MTRRVFHALLAVGLAGTASCTTEAIDNDGDRPPGGEWAPDTRPVDDGPDLPDPSISEPAEPNDIGDAPGAFELPATGAAPAVLRGCLEPRDRDADGTLDVDRDAFGFDVDGPAYIEISIEGSGDALAGFLVESDDSDLSADGWLRAAADPGAPGVSRRVFLPKAGRYYLVAADSRSIVSGVPMGNRTACYEAQVAQLDVPGAGAFGDAGATGQTLGAPLFYRYAGTTGRTIAYGQLQYGHAGAIGSVVIMLNGEYVTSAATADGVAGALMPTHGADDEVVLVADSVFRVLPGTSYDIAVEGTGLLAEPGDGSPVVLTQPAAKQPVELYFYASAGELVQFNSLSDGRGYTATVVRPDKAGTIAELCAGCPTWISIRKSGLHHVRVWGNVREGESFTVAFLRRHVEPKALDMGLAANGDLFGTDRAWYFLDVTAGDEIGFAVTPMSGNGFAEADVRVYNTTSYGQIDSTDPFIGSVPAMCQGSSLGEPMSCTFARTGRVLVSIADAGAYDGDERFHLAVTRNN